MKHVFYKCILKNSSMYEEGYDVLSGSRATGDGYYESSIVGIEGNQIELNDLPKTEGDTTEKIDKEGQE